METLPVFPCYVGETNELWRKRFRERIKWMKVQLPLGLLVVVASCGPQREPQQPVNNAAAPILPAPSAPPAVENNVTAELPSSAAAPQASLPEPKGPIDPKSVEAAGQVVQHYGALIEQSRWNQSWELWSNPDAA